MWPRDVMNSSRWDFWFSKSGCMNNNWQQQQSDFPFTHLNPSHCAFSPFCGQSPQSWIIISIIPLNYLGIVGWFFNLFHAEGFLSLPCRSCVVLHKQQNVFNRFFFFPPPSNCIFRAFRTFLYVIFFLGYTGSSREIFWK